MAIKKMVVSGQSAAQTTIAASLVLAHPRPLYFLHSRSTPAHNISLAFGPA